MGQRGAPGGRRDRVPPAPARGAAAAAPHSVPAPRGRATSRQLRLRGQRGAERPGRHGARRGTNFPAQCPGPPLPQARTPAATAAKQRRLASLPAGAGGGTVQGTELAERSHRFRQEGKRSGNNRPQRPRGTSAPPYRVTPYLRPARTLTVLKPSRDRVLLSRESSPADLRHPTFQKILCKPSTQE
ncbi:translation initiation factor IF-2-like [Pipra filicauda]|uniref:Translation initiation factor IF-2-like n=1 Tax=Pipra filicauda TaxID=649802 RepID=A0A7R5KIM3_9PASS|nr:translation initiation factor IF-2-like [Pipra filicauda]